MPTDCPTDQPTNQPTNQPGSANKRTSDADGGSQLCRQHDEVVLIDRCHGQQVCVFDVVVAALDVGRHELAGLLVPADVARVMHVVRWLVGVEKQLDIVMLKTPPYVLPCLQITMVLTRNSMHFEIISWTLSGLSLIHI